MSTTMMKRLQCWAFGHTYHIHQQFGPHSRRVICLRCRGDWGMNDSVRALIPWDSDLESLYRNLGFQIIKR